MRPVLGLLGLLAVGIFASACDGVVVYISTGPTPVHPAFHDGGTILVGVPVNGTLSAHGSAVQYQVVPPRNGTLVVRVSWEQSRGLIELLVAETLFTPVPGGKPPIAGRLPVHAGQSYTVRVMDGAPRGYDTLSLPFVVTTSME